MTQLVLVTGGAGYIGSVVVDQLLNRGYKVVILDDLSNGHRQAVARGASFIQGGVGNRELIEALFEAEGIESIIHLAAFALVPESVAQPQKYVTNNVTAARVLLEAAVRAKVRRFVFSSSCAVYGHPAKVPITEDSPQAPVNPYGETKRDFERLLADVGPRNGMGVVSLRYFNASGATARLGEDHDPETHLIPNVLAAALGKRAALEIYGTDYPTPDGTAVRDYVHVTDIADARLRALELERALRQLGHLSAEDRARVEQFSQALLNKFLHQPTIALKAAAEKGRGYGLLEALRRLFGMEPGGSE